VVIFHGGHMRAGLALGEEVFAEAGCTLPVPSRPGYGRTPLSTGTSVSGFADATLALLEPLGITRGSGGHICGGTNGGHDRRASSGCGGSADPAERRRLAPWPGRWTHLVAHVMFAGSIEQAKWGMWRALLRVAPDVGLRLQLRSLSTLPAGRSLASLEANQRARLVALPSSMRSGSGRRRVGREPGGQPLHLVRTRLAQHRRHDPLLSRRCRSSGAAGPAVVERRHIDAMGRAGNVRIDCSANHVPAGTPPTRRG
jgi:hypothetical protein